MQTLRTALEVEIGERVTWHGVPAVVVGYAGRGQLVLQTSSARVQAWPQHVRRVAS